jgi:NADH-quinone oxidoreductase subunit A
MRPVCAAPARARERSQLLDNYLPILIFLAVAGGFGLLLLALGWVLGPRRPAFEDSRTKFDVRYYLVAILFIIFDLEIAFLFPWAVSLDAIGGFGLLSMGVFLAVLVVGFIYEWKKGALEWD